MVLDSSIVSGGAGMMVGMFMWFLRGLNARVSALEKKGSDTSERVTTGEAQYPGIVGRLDRIESKLDARLGPSKK